LAELKGGKIYMKLPKVIAITIIIAIAFLVTSVSAGNGIDLNGQHYNLNLIGMKNAKNWDGMQDSNSHVIFVGYNKNGAVTTRIYLQPGDTFDVLDGNGVDGTALFQLPKPYTEEEMDAYDLSVKESECLSSYQIYIRVNAGKGSGILQAGACNDTEMGTDGYEVCTDAAGTVWYHTGDGVIDLSKNSKFEQVTHELTTVVIEETHYGLFSEDAFNLYGVDTYFWELMNNGLKNVQIRFYPTPEDYCITTGYES
jgi:hypothetical protein